MLHKHHIIPLHIQGSDDPSNIELLSVEQHAERHKELWEQHGRWQDNLAWRFLSGIASKKEAVAEAIAMGSRIGGMRPKSQLHRKRIGQSKIGKPRPWTDEWRRKCILASSFQKGVPKVKVLCSCGKLVDMGNLKRWHFQHKVVNHG